MRVRFAGLAGLSIVVLLGLVSTPNLVAQEKAPKANKAQKKKAEPQRANIQGMIQNMGKDASTITVRTGTGTGTLTRMVVYNANTKFLYGHSNDNKPGTIAKVKESNFISCVGTFDAKKQLMATECIYRETK